jgi:hypothetical protein
MQIRLNTDWWSELDFDKFYLMDDLSFEDFERLHTLCELLSEVLNHIMDKLYDFCDAVQFTWYYDYWKIKRFDEMENMLKKEIEKFNLKRYLNSPIELSYNKIKESLLKRCREYISDYCNDQDLIEYKLQLGIA